MSDESINTLSPLNPICTCENCGFQWNRGESSGHSCVEWLKDIAAYWERRYEEVCHLQDEYAKYKIAEVIRLKAKIEDLERIGACMSANQCLHPGGVISDDGGYSKCPLKEEY